MFFNEVDCLSQGAVGLNFIFLEHRISIFVGILFLLGSLVINEDGLLFLLGEDPLLYLLTKNLLLSLQSSFVAIAPIPVSTGMGWEETYFK